MLSAICMMHNSNELQISFIIESRLIWVYIACNTDLQSADINPESNLALSEALSLFRLCRCTKWSAVFATHMQRKNKAYLCLQAMKTWAGLC